MLTQRNTSAFAVEIGMDKKGCRGFQVSIGIGLAAAAAVGSDSGYDFPFLNAGSSTSYCLQKNVKSGQCAAGPYFWKSKGLFPSKILS